MTRYMRLMIPALASAIIAFLVLSVVARHLTKVDGLSSWTGGLMIVEPNILDAVYNGAIRPFWEQRSSYNVVLWTMGIELWGSFLVYLFCFFQRRHNVVLCILGAAFIIVTVSIFDRRLAFGLLCFMVGLSFYQLRLRINSPLIATLMLLLGLYLAGVHSNSISYPFIDELFGTHGSLLINITSALLIVLGVLSLTKVQTWLENPALVQLGRRSFSIYLVHLPILFIVTASAKYLLGYNSYFEAKAILLSVTVVCLSIVLAGSMNRIDTLAMKVSKKIHS